MRVTGGIFRGRTIRSTPGMAARPTTDKVRQSIFNILRNDIEETDFLDLFAGSGSMGIEALSRGANSAVFVESGYHQAECIKGNVHSLDLKPELIKSDYKAACRLLAEAGRTFDIIFADPPYEKYSLDEIAEIVLQYDLLRPEGFLIIEHIGGQVMKKDLVVLIKRQKYGQTEVSFYARKQPATKVGDLPGDL